MGVGMGMGIGHTGIVRNTEQEQGYVARTEAEGPSPCIGRCASRAASSRGGQRSNAKPWPIPSPLQDFLGMGHGSQVTFALKF